MQTKPLTDAGGPLDVRRIRADFPILTERVHGKPLVYLDNAATSQKPSCVIDAISHFYEHDCSNVHRGLHELSARATASFEGARDKVQKFIGAADRREIIFTRGTTEAINLVTHTFGQTRIGAGDEIIVSGLEHHSNIVPWQMLCERQGAKLRVIPVDDQGDLILEEYDRLLSSRTKLVAVATISNAIGTVVPVKTIIERAHAVGALALLDAAQSPAHETIDVQELDADFVAISGHKMHSATGIGVLYGKGALLESLPPFHGGGDMIHSVTFAKTTYKGLPHRFEAGTPDIAGAIALGAAVDYLDEVGVARIAAAEQTLVGYALDRIGAIPGVRIVGTPQKRASIVSFVADKVHPHDLGTALDLDGVAIRAGHHCAQPLMEHFSVPATVRASFAMYNTREEVDALVTGVQRAIEVFS